MLSQTEDCACGVYQEIKKESGFDECQHAGKIIWTLVGPYGNNGRGWKKKSPLCCQKCDFTVQWKCFQRPKTVHAVCIRIYKKKKKSVYDECQHTVRISLTPVGRWVNDGRNKFP